MTIYFPTRYRAARLGYSIPSRATTSQDAMPPIEFGYPRIGEQRPVELDNINSGPIVAFDDHEALVGCDHVPADMRWQTGSLSDSHDPGP